MLGATATGSGVQGTSSGGAGVYGIDSSAGVGVEYYLRQRVAFDVAVRYHDAPGPGEAGPGDERLHFVTLWVGHYVRF